MFDANYSHGKSVQISFSPIHQKIANRRLRSRNLSTVLGAIAISLVFCKSLAAESSRKYCISQVNQNNLEQKTNIDLYSDNDYPEILATRNSQEYTIAVDQSNPREIVLRRSNEQSAISQMIFSPDGGTIRNLVLGEDDWLWIDKNTIDYVMKVNFAQEKSDFEPPIQLPKLSVQPCHLLRRLFQKCPHQQYSYSPSLQSIFVSGYPLKSWRKHNHLNLEYVAGEKKPVPELLKRATFIADIPEWNGVLFRQSSGEALFYDGKTVINISADFRQLEGGENFQDWDIKTTAGGRSFIGKFDKRTSRDPLFLMELNTKPGFKPIYLSEDFKHKWLDIFTFPDDTENTLWILTRKAIFAEVKQRIQSVITLPLSFFVERTDKKDLTTVKQNNNFISFTVKNHQDDRSAYYLLKRNSDNAKCETSIDIEQQTILNKS